MPEVTRIERARLVAQEAIERGMTMPLLPDEQDHFGGDPFNDDLDTVKAGLDEAELPWESGLPIIQDVKTKADEVYNAIPEKTEEDTAAYNAFVASYNTFKNDLTEARNISVNELTALGNAWRETLIAILNSYLEISLGEPVALNNCSGRNSVDTSLVLDDIDPRSWKSEYGTFLSATTGPAIVPSQAGYGANEWHEYAVNYAARLMEYLNVYGNAWQSAYSSMTYAGWQDLSTSVDPSQPYQIFLLKRGSLNVLLENLNAIRSEANRYYGAFGDAEDAIKMLDSDLSTLQSQADAYRQFLVNNAGTVPPPEFDEYITVNDGDVPGISERMIFASDGISILETETLIAFLRRLMEEFDFEADEIQEQATYIGNKADVIAFEINRMLAFNDAISSKRAYAEEMLKYKFDYSKDVFYYGNYNYLFDSLEILDNDIWQHVDTSYYHANPPDIQTMIVPHVNYIKSLGSTALNRFAWLTEQIWSVTDNLTFAVPEIKTNPWTVGTGYEAGESFLILAENKDLVDEFTKVRFLKYHSRPYTEPMGYITLDEIRKGLPRTRTWVEAQTGGGYAELIIERITTGTLTIPVNQKSQLPFTIRVVDGTGQPLPGVPVSLDYNPDTAPHSAALVSTDTQGLAEFFPGPYNETGERTVTFSVLYNPGDGTSPSIIAFLDAAIDITADSDGDGCGDAWEILHGFDPYEDFDGAADFDYDDLTNAQEAALGTDPNVADSDGDGYDDGAEVAAGSDPLNANDIPSLPMPDIPVPQAMRLGTDWEKTSDYINVASKEEYPYKFKKIIPFKNRIWAFGYSDVWSSENGIQWTKVSEIPDWAPRNAFTIAVHNERLWVTGGTVNTASGTTYYSDVWVSDDGIEWNRVKAVADFGPRSNPHLLSMGDSLWLIGGYLYDTKNQAYGEQNDVWTSTDGIQWTQVTPSATWPLRRSSGFSSAVFEDKLWIMGGDIYDSATAQWTTFSDIWNSTDGATWNHVTNRPEWPARYGSSVAVFNDRLWLFGGATHTTNVYMPFNEIWTSKDGIIWNQAKGPVNIQAMAFSFGEDLWAYFDCISNISGYEHNELWRSRGPVTDDTVVEPVPADANPINFSAGASHFLAVKSDGTLWAWGSNYAGQLGEGTTNDSNKPLQIGTDTDWKSVAAGGNFSLGLKTDGTIWGWGQNYYGQLGNGENTYSLTPVQAGTDTDWASITAGHGHTLALKTDGSLWAWGNNNGGQLGEGTKDNKNVPTQIGTDRDWICISAGSYHSSAVKGDGSVWTWGSNGYGQLGTYTSTKEFLVPSQGGEEEWSALSSDNMAVSDGAVFSSALRSDGLLHMWGSNSSGQIGAGSSLSYYTTAKSIAPYDAWVALAAGNSHMAAIKNNNTLWAWGDILDLLPEGITSVSKYLPAPVGSDRDWTAVTSGGDFSVARKADGSLWAWGKNGYGQLGNGTNTSSATPTRVLALGPTEADRDGDWMDDTWENEYFGDTSRDGEGDYDGDGLTDFIEFQIGTLPDNVDSDGDGMHDKWEIAMGLDPLTDDSQGDKDQDGVSNLDEYSIVCFRSVEDGGWNARRFTVSGQTLYVIDGEGQLKAYDSTDPRAPALLGTYNGNFVGAFGIRVTKGITIVADGNAIFQMIDVSNPAQMTKVGEYLVGGYIQGFDVSDRFICATDSSNNLLIIDIVDPANPQLRGTYANTDQRGMGSVFISGTRAYVTLSGNAIQIIDIANPDSPAKIGQYEAGDLVWPPAVALSGTIMAASVRPWEEGASLKFIDSSDAADLREIGRYPVFIDFIAMSENLLIASTGGDDLDVIDIRNPAAPLRIADINNLSCDWGSGLILSGNLLFLSHGGGVAIVDISRFRRPLISGAPGDVDHSESVELTDAVLALQILTGLKPYAPAYADCDVNGDGLLGLEDVLYILQTVSAMRAQ